MAGHAVHPPRGRIVDRPAQEGHAAVCRPDARPGQRPAALGRRDARPPRLGRQEHRLLHAERIENMCLRILVEPLPADAADDVAEQEEVDVAVDEPLAGRRGRDFLDGAPDGFVGAVELHLELQVGPQSGRVREQMADRDAGLADTARTPG